MDLTLLLLNTNNSLPIRIARKLMVSTHVQYLFSSVYILPPVFNYGICWVLAFGFPQENQPSKLSFKSQMWDSKKNKRTKTIWIRWELRFHTKVLEYRHILHYICIYFNRVVWNLSSHLNDMAYVRWLLSCHKNLSDTSFNRLVFWILSYYYSIKFFLIIGTNSRLMVGYSLSWYLFTSMTLPPSFNYWFCLVGLLLWCHISHKSITDTSSG